MPNPTCGLYAAHQRAHYYERNTDVKTHDFLQGAGQAGAAALAAPNCGVHADTLTALQRTTQALDRAKDALRKIALNHPCDLHDRIARFAMEDIKEIEG